MERSKKKRSVSRNIVKGLVKKVGEILNDENKRHEAERMIKTIEAKMLSIDKLNEELLDSVPEDQMDAEIEDTTMFEIDVMKELDSYKERLSTKVKVESDVRDNSRSDATIPVISNVTSNTGTDDVTQAENGNSSKFKVKLPKIEIKKFYGDPVQWQQFFDIFNATITENRSLSEVEKFTYLRGMLGGEAERCIDGITLSGDNFKRAMSLLKER